MQSLFSYKPCSFQQRSITDQILLRNMGESMFQVLKTVVPCRDIARLGFHEYTGWPLGDYQCRRNLGPAPVLPT